MAIHNPMEEKLLAMYERIGMGNCRTCSICRDNVENLSPPVTAWGVGNNFTNEHKKILFVGKNARGYFSKPLNGKFHEVFDDSRQLWQNSWPYWSYTREITGKIFGDDSFEHIAFTNLVKCNNSPDKDTTSDLVKRNCICNLKVFSEEVKIIRPTHIIFYTSWYYDEYIPRTFDTFNVLFNGKKKIGANNAPWLEAKAKLNDWETFVLRTRHPQYAKKSDFINAICSWIKTTQP